MPPKPDDFTCLAAAKRLFPHAHTDASSVEGPYCAIRPAHRSKHGDLHIRLFADLMEAEEWARACPCGSASPQTHFVRVVEALEPAESAAFRNRADWTRHRAAELLQKWAYLAERLARGPAPNRNSTKLLPPPKPPETSLGSLPTPSRILPTVSQPSTGPTPTKW